MRHDIQISDELLIDAKLSAERAHRSIMEQIEFWVRLGRAIEPLLDGERALALQRSDRATSISECLATVDSPEGRKRVANYVNMRPFPHFEAAPGGEDILVRIDEDGTRTVGRFVGREFRAIQ